MSKHANMAWKFLLVTGVFFLAYEVKNAAEKIGNRSSGIERVAEFPETPTKATHPRASGDRFADVVTVEEFGAEGNGDADDTRAIQSAIDAVEARGGGFVYLDAKSYLISDTIEVKSSIKLIGAGGGGQYPLGSQIASPDFLAMTKTRLVAGEAFPTGRAMVSVHTPDADEYCYQSVEISGMMLDCAGVAERGLDIVSVKNSKFSDLLIFRATALGILEDCVSTETSMTNPRYFKATQYNNFHGITVWLGTTGTAVGWRQTGNTRNNVNQSVYSNIKIVHADGTGFDFVNCDTNTYIGLSTYSFLQGYGGVFHGSTPAEPDKFARKLTFVNLLFGGANANYAAAQAGGASTITLNAKSDCRDDIFNGKLIKISKGTGVGQTAKITAYDGTTKVATVTPAWTVVPDATSWYQIQGGGGAIVHAGTHTASHGHIAVGVQTIGNGSKDFWFEDNTSFTILDTRQPTFSDTTTARIYMQSNRAFTGGVLTSINSVGRTTTGIHELGKIQLLTNGATGAEGSRYDFFTYRDGKLDTSAYLQNGLVITRGTSAAPSGGDKGAGTINVKSGYFNNGIGWLSGAGSPEGVVTALPGSIYSRTDGGASTTLYVKESGAGNTGWTAK